MFLSIIVIKLKTGKKDKVKLRCCHEEMIRLLTGAVEDNVQCTNCSKMFPKRTGGKCKYCIDRVQYCSASCQEEHWPAHQKDCSKTIAYMTNSASYLLKTTKLPLKTEVLKEIKRRNALETLGQDGWPTTYYTNEESCPLCAAELSVGEKKQQKTSSDSSFLITKDHCIPVLILSKKCRACLLAVQAFRSA
eukprot:GFUD01040398.1.p1 GENE.GFUD01040398.1~~GFUD01040398.1.p1  ORF type:complete len:191 (-),score=30.07 GFUD01040398.1:323-895(-)